MAWSNPTGKLGVSPPPVPVSIWAVAGVISSLGPSAKRYSTAGSGGTLRPRWGTVSHVPWPGDLEHAVELEQVDCCGVAEDVWAHLAVGSSVVEVACVAAHKMPAEGVGDAYHYRLLTFLRSADPRGVR